MVLKIILIPILCVLAILEFRILQLKYLDLFQRVMYDIYVKYFRKKKTKK